MDTNVTREFCEGSQPGRSRNAIVPGMTRLVPILCGVLTSATLVSGQTRDPDATFEVVSVKRSAPVDPARFDVMSGMQSTGDRWTAQNVTLLLILQMTYNVLPEQIVGAPSWLAQERFDINAKASGEVAGDQIPLMVKHLLSDRFKLKLHTEQRPIAVHALVRARSDGQLGPGLRSNAECNALADARSRGEVMPAPGQRPPCGGVTMKTVDGVRQLRIRGQPLSNMLVLTGARAALGGPVVDRTTLAGTFDIDIDYVPQAAFMGGSVKLATGSPIGTAVQDQLGLKFERRDEPLNVIVIDHIEMPSPD